MRNGLATVAVLAVLTAPVAAQTGVVADRWQIAYVEGVRAGHVRTLTVEETDKGQRRLKTTVEMRLQVKRFTDTIQLGMDTGTTETPEGYVTGVFMKQYLGKVQKLEIRGEVKGDQLILTLNKDKPLDPAPWNDQVLGINGQYDVFKKRNVQPGDKFGYMAFEPAINLVVTTRVQVKDRETVELWGGSERRKLLRVEIRGDKVQTYQPPLLVTWLDEDREPVASETDIPGLGKIVLYRATKEQALTPLREGVRPQVNQYIMLRQRILRPHETTSALYRITIPNDDDPASVFARDLRQKVLSTTGAVVELQIRKGASAADAKVSPEFLASSHFITSADAKVKEHARRAVGTEADPWKKAVKIERWVNERMVPKSHEALATADQVARTLEGDCTEFAMLAAAMCRAEGVPSRTAIGLIYGDIRNAPAFVFHMWTEVWINGLWMPIDATLGRGGIGATHLKITDQSWQDEQSMAPLLPTLRVLGRLSIEVIRAEINAQK